MATVVVTGFNQLQRSIAATGPAVSKAMRAGLRDAAEPVSRLAEELSLSEIPGMAHSPQWAINRIGVTQHAVYIAPKQRGSKSRTDRRLRRPNLFGLIMDRSYEPASARGEAIVQATVDGLLRDVTTGVMT